MVIGLFVTSGYVMSQLAVWRGEATDYARRIDQPPVALLATVLLGLVLVVGLLPEDRS